MRARDDAGDSTGACPSCGAVPVSGESPVSICVRCALDLALSGPFEETPNAPVPEAAGASPVARVRIGPYRLQRVLGEGGMGIVWEAEQEEPVRRRIALKCIRLGTAGDQFQARFESERQALALMSHPNIARAFDAGSTPDGHPYYAMELVDGPWVTLYCDAQRLDIRRRLEVFLEVCRGIQHAHQRGVIHRDIKPSNILVQTEEGRPVPKIIDFGVAKAMGALLTDRTLVTRMGQTVGTPEYMSPEQAGPAGFDVDTRTDVYSLGALLYELLTGRLPFGTSDGDPDALRRRIREEEPVRPSVRVASPDDGGLEAAQLRGAEPAHLSRSLRGDLDWIVLKALAKDRARRYGTPDELAADIGRYIVHEPVLAGPPSAMYRTWKFVRRHRFGVTAAALAAAGVVAFAVVMAVQTRRIARERDHAEQVSQFLEQAFQVAGPERARGREVTARDILDRGSERINDDLAGQPEVQARLLRTLGGIYADLGVFPKAEALLDRSLEIRRSLLGTSHPDTLQTMARLARLYDDMGRYEDSARLHAGAAEGQRRALGANHPETLTSLNRVATAYERQGRYDESERLYAEVFAARRRVLGKDDQGIFESLDDLGAIKMARGRYEEAAALFEEEIEGRTRVSGRDDPSTLWAMNNLANVYFKQRRYEDAEKLHSETLSLRRRVLGNEHARTLASLHNLAEVYDRLGRTEEAARLLEEELPISRTVNGPEHRNTLLGTAALAGIYLKLGREEDAERLFSDALETQRRVLGAEHPDTLGTMNGMAELHIARDRLDEANRLLHQSLEGMRRTLGAGHPDLASPLHKLAVVAVVRGDRAGALDRLREAIAHDAGQTGDILEDDRLASLRGDPEFERLVAAAMSGAHEAAPAGS